MVNFVKGIVESNAPGAVYRGIVSDRDLIVLLANGQRLKIFNHSWDIDDKLVVGEEYELIVCQEVVTKVQTTPFETEDPYHWAGRLLDPEWKALPDSYRLADRHLKGTWLLVETPFGDMIMSRDNLTTVQRSELRAGQAIWWRALRLDLYGAV